MDEKMKLMCVLAHPDDETLGIGGILARYAAEGVETYLITATRGERGWFGDPGDYPGPEALGRTRQGELEEAARVLGLKEVTLLDYVDGDLDQAEPGQVIEMLAAHLRRVRPQVVITFGPFGVYGHPDHIAVSQFTAAAIVEAASTGGAGEDGQDPHRVSKLYYLVETEVSFRTYQDVFGDLVMCIDGDERRGVPWPEWAITTRIDTSAYTEQVWGAIYCHCSQLPGYQTLIQLPQSQREKLWAENTLYRAFSLVNSGREVERDLFEGMR